MAAARCLSHIVIGLAAAAAAVTQVVVGWLKCVRHDERVVVVLYVLIIVAAFRVAFAQAAAPLSHVALHSINN